MKQCNKTKKNQQFYSYTKKIKFKRNSAMQKNTKNNKLDKRSHTTRS